jgi:D-inositol-3-phosphate glycosyltransferase
MIFRGHTAKQELEATPNLTIISNTQTMNSTTDKRIALISVHGDPAIEIGKEEAGGQNVYVRNVGEALSKLGWQVDMFTRKVSAEQEAIVQHRTNCRTIRLQAGSLEFIPRDNLFEYLPEFIENLLKFQTDNKIEYPLIHTNYWHSSWVGMELKKLQGSKQVHTYHSLGAVKYNTIETIPQVANKRLEVERKVLETAERIVATSPQEEIHMRELVSKEGYIDIIPCGTDIERFGSIDQKTAREKLDIDPEAKLVMYVGRFDPRKGIETLVRAVGESQFRGNDKLQLIIGGGSTPGQSDGLECDRIQEIVKELGMGGFTKLTGRLTQEELPYYYAAADVCVVPSHYEPFGLVAIESMASYTPVVASDVGGLQFTVVPEETGLLAPAQDIPAFANAIDQILSDAQWRDELGKAGRRRVESKFSWDGVAAQLSELYTELLQPTTKDKEVVLINQ